MSEDIPGLLREHLRYHLIDGRWHDFCRYCLRRRREGGTGNDPVTKMDGTVLCSRHR